MKFISKNYFLILILISCQPNIKKMNLSNDQAIDIEGIGKKVKDIEHQLFNAIMQKDTSKISTILSDKFTYKNPKFGEISRDEFLTNIKSLSIDIESVNSDNLSVKVLNDSLAIITGYKNQL